MDLVDPSLRRETIIFKKHALAAVEKSQRSREAASKAAGSKPRATAPSGHTKRAKKKDYDFAGN